MEIASNEWMIAHITKEKKKKGLYHPNSGRQAK
jgi:hypothetical protein